MINISTRAGIKVQKKHYSMELINRDRSERSKYLWNVQTCPRCLSTLCDQSKKAIMHDRHILICFYVIMWPILVRLEMSRYIWNSKTIYNMSGHDPCPTKGQDAAKRDCRPIRGTEVPQTALQRS